MDRADYGPPLRQFLATARLGLLRYRRSKHLLSAFALLWLPVLLMAAVAGFQMFMSGFAFENPLQLDRKPFFDEAKTINVKTALETYRLTFQNAFIYFSIFFVAMIFGQAAVREETDEQTLHYLFLQPVPRWILLAGKLAGFLCMALPLLASSLALCQVLALAPLGPGAFAEAVADHGRLTALLQEGLVLALALVAWCGLFMAIGTAIKAPIIMFFIYGWEVASNFLPQMLQQFTISFYVRSLLPARSLQDPGAIQILAEPAGVIESLLVVGTVVAISLGATALMVRWRECVYSDA
ncbi:MAG: ABC transporter permease subunit [Candidatus Sumerlaeia bacterium]|nr:ABC transporter permease subunit [Candidatus Sumerlaeia bacterium]